jgi:DNA polymerase elongation subunit (family B)
VTEYYTEEAMFEDYAKLCLDLDPDVLAGFEIQSSSWGYLKERYELLLGKNCAVFIGI